MRPLQAPVIARLEAMPSVWQIHVQAPEIARNASPGQFAMALRGQALDPYLRVALPIHRIGKESVAFLLDEGDAEVAMLAQGRIDEPMDLLGPLGHGFDLRPSCQRLLLIAQGMGIAPLIALAEMAIAENRQVTLVSVAADSDRLYPSDLLPKQIEHQAIIQEGAGFDGLRAVLAETMPWAEQICAAGSMSLYRALRLKMSEDPIRDRAGLTQVYLYAKMGCGIGICNACSVKVKRGMRHICTDGPVLDLYELL